MDKKTVGMRHREAREEVLQMTVSEYARVMGVKEVTVYAWEAGRSFVPHEIMGLLEHKYGVTASWLLTGESRNSEAQKSRSSEIQKLRNPETQKLRSSEIQKLRNPETQKLRSSEKVLEVLSFAIDELRRIAPYQATRIPMLSLGVSAGLPAEAGDEVEEEIDLTELLLEHPDSTYFIRVVGDSMTDAGIGNGDTLIVDCAVQPKPGQVVIAKVFGELTVKRYLNENNAPVLRAENRKYKDIAVTPDMDFSIVGVVRSCIKAF